MIKKKKIIKIVSCLNDADKVQTGTNNTLYNI